MKKTVFSHKAEAKGKIATIGVFDGVHKGHRYLISAVKEYALTHELESGVITFTDHPKRLFAHDKHFVVLSSHEEKLSLLSKCGINWCTSFQFNETLAALTAREFIHKVLKDQLGVTHLMMGYDNRFGSLRSDSFEDYVKYGEEVGIQILKAPVYETQEGVTPSSTTIREALTKGNIDIANMLLGYRYNLSGKVIKGFQIGTKIGFPTANIKPLDAYKVIPKRGVYAINIKVGGKQYNGMLNIGTNPTFHNHYYSSIEAHLIDADLDLYNKVVEVEFVARMRDEQKFSGVTELIAQLNKDKERAIELLNR